MTINDISTELTKANAYLTETQGELEDVLASLPEVIHNQERGFNAKLLEIFASQKVSKDSALTESVKKAIAETAVEQLSLQRSVLEYKREALKSRLDTIKTNIMSLQTQARLVSDELNLDRYKPQSVGTF